MSQSANVHSIDAIKEFRAALVRFIEDTKNGLGAAEMEIRRATDWILHERPTYWQMEIKRRKEHLAEAQAELFRRRLQARPGSEIKDTEQKEMVRNATRRLMEAEDKLQRVKKWGPLFQHAVSEYLARARPTSDMLEGDTRLAVALLDRMAAALDAYIATAPPSFSAMEATANAYATASAAVASSKSETPAAAPPDEATPPSGSAAEPTEQPAVEGAAEAPEAVAE